MGFIEQVKLTSDGSLRKRIRMAMVTAARDVQGEDPTGVSSGKYSKRQTLANKVITTSGLGTPNENLLDMFTWLVVSNPAITDESNDGDIQYTVNSVWDDAAGVTGSD